MQSARQHLHNIDLTSDFVIVYVQLATEYLGSEGRGVGMQDSTSLPSSTKNDYKRVFEDIAPVYARLNSIAYDKANAEVSDKPTNQGTLDIAAAMDAARLAQKGPNNEALTTVKTAAQWMTLARKYFTAAKLKQIKGQWAAAAE